MKINFKDENTFCRLEDDAIDGALLYDDFPPCEYKYFSKLSKLGYNNRHKGWSAEICEELKREYKLKYTKEKEQQERFYNMACRMQDNIKKSGTLISQLYKAKTADDKLLLALEALELMTGEDGLKKRNMEDLK